MLPVILMVVVAVMAVAVAAYVALSDSRRRTVVERAMDGGAAWGGGRAAVIATEGANKAPLSTRLAQFVPRSWIDDSAMETTLIQAGYDSPTAPLTYAVSRMACLLALPALAILAFPDSMFSMVVAGVAGAMFGFILPRGYIARRARLRQERLRRSLPDALDLMVVCVEAGVSLDAAILRVAKELQIAHTELAYEFTIVNRKTNAGVTREEALRGLWMRTGVEDIRALVSSMIQSEKWGTSISKVLRVASETLRRKRRQAAEKRAALAPLKMTIPLVVLILPAMFIVILGPVALKMIETFK